MSTRVEAVGDLKSVLAEGHQYEFLNLYKGVLVTCSARALQIGGDEAVFLVQPPESTSLVWERYTWLAGETIEKPLRARVASYDIVSETARLKDFKYTSSRWNERKQVRVEPNDPIPVAIESEGQRVVGSLADISTIGIGVYLHAFEPDHPFQHAQVVQVSLRLPVLQGSISMSGKIRGLNLSADYHRMSIHFIPQPEEIEKVKRYVDQRRQEILEEIPRLHETLLKSKTGE